MQLYRYLVSSDPSSVIWVLFHSTYPPRVYLCPALTGYWSPRPNVADIEFGVYLLPQVGALIHVFRCRVVDVTRANDGGSHPKRIDRALVQNAVDKQGQLQAASHARALQELSSFKLQAV